MHAHAESWGRYPRVDQASVALVSRDAALPAIPGTLLPFGNGRSYGDSCLNGGGTLLCTRNLDRYIAFDAASGVLRCESGTLLSEIIDLCLPQGWFLPVTPGTKYATVGGAIANDVHGKNHHVAGTFGAYLRVFELLRSDGSRMRCSPSENAEWFAASIGGLGLTGLITWAEIQMKPVQGPWLDTDTHKFGDLDEFFALSEGAAGRHEYTMAWIDCASSGAALGRGLFTSAEHAPIPTGAAERDPHRLAMPFTPPISLVNSLSLRTFNWLYYHRQRQPVQRALQHYDPVFYPLDGIRDWNRMYGPRGFLQHQCVIPPAEARRGIEELLRQIAASGQGSFLAVLKVFGDKLSPGMLSFPRPGATLALDFPNAGPKTFQLLERLDAVVAAAGGAVYPAKDARMSGAHFRQFFPAWERFQTFIDPRFSSSFWRRVMG
jgi:FAD/FMN-containing dehydrogenase